jgi:hypothetical protein
MNPDFPFRKSGLEIMTSASACPARKRRGFCCPDLILEISLVMAPEKRADRGKREVPRPTENFLMEIFG